MAENGEIPDWLKKISNKPPRESSEEEFRFGPETEGFVEHRVEGKRLVRILLSSDARTSFNQLLEGIEGVKGVDRLALGIFMQGSSENVERLGEKVPALKEKIFFIYGSVRDPQYFEVSPVTTGRVLKVHGEPETISVALEESYEMFDVHSEPGYPPSEPIHPSTGDLEALVGQTDTYRDEGWTMRTIGILVRPDQKKAMIYQQKTQLPLDLSDYREDIKKAEGDKRKIKTVLEKTGFRQSLVDFPFKRKQLKKQMDKFAFKVGREK